MEAVDETKNTSTRRKFLKQASLAGAGIVLGALGTEALAQDRDKQMGPPTASEAAGNKERREAIHNLVVLKVAGNITEEGKAGLASELSAELFTRGVSNPQVLLESDLRLKTLKKAPPALMWDCKASLIPGKSKTTKSWSKTILKGAVSIGAGVAQTAIGGRAGGVVGDVARGEAGVNSGAGTIHYSTYRLQGGLSFGSELSSINEELVVKAELNSHNAWEYSLVLPSRDGRGTSEEKLQIATNHYELDEARSQQVAIHHLLKHKSPSVIQSLVEDFKTNGDKAPPAGSFDAGTKRPRP